MTNHIIPSKEELLEQGIDKLKLSVRDDAWAALKKYFQGEKDVPDVRISMAVLGILAKEQQSIDMEKQLDLLERRFSASAPELKGGNKGDSRARLSKKVNRNPHFSRIANALKRYYGGGSYSTAAPEQLQFISANRLVKLKESGKISGNHAQQLFDKLFSDVRQGTIETFSIS